MSENCCTDCCSRGCEAGCSTCLNENCQCSRCNCQDSCQCNSCQCSSCSCGYINPSMAIQLLTFAGIIFSTLISVAIMGLIQAFNPKGPLTVTLFGSVVLAINLTGLRIGNGSQKTALDPRKEILSSSSTSYGWVTFVHSHHGAKQRMDGHEFKIGYKYFCTGCYGILTGTIITIALLAAYILFGMPDYLVVPVIILIPVLFAPIVLRYTVFTEMRTSKRLLSNMLLPVGCGLTIIVFDFLFQNWLLNVFFVLFTLMVGFTRGIVANNSKK